MNNSNGTFSEIANYSNVYGTDWSWGALFFDADNDGYNDIYVCNGINKDLSDLDFLDFFSNDVYQRLQQTGKRDEISEVLKHIPVTALPNRVFKNDGQLSFKDVTKQWGFNTPSFSNSVAYGDLDNDGDIDIIVNNLDDPAYMYRNNSDKLSKNNWLKVKLDGEKNKFGIGCEVTIWEGDKKQIIRDGYNL